METLKETLEKNKEPNSTNKDIKKISDEISKNKEEDGKSQIIKSEDNDQKTKIKLDSDKEQEFIMEISKKTLEIIKNTDSKKGDIKKILDDLFKVKKQEGKIKISKSDENDEETKKEVRNLKTAFEEILKTQQWSDVLDDIDNIFNREIKEDDYPNTGKETKTI